MAIEAEFRLALTEMAENHLYPMAQPVQEPEEERRAKTFSQVAEERKAEDKKWQNRSMLNDSICSILDDKGLSSEKKKAMISESVSQYLAVSEAEMVAGE